MEIVKRNCYIFGFAAFFQRKLVICINLKDCLQKKVLNIQLFFSKSIRFRKDDKKPLNYFNFVLCMGSHKFG